MYVLDHADQLRVRQAMYFGDSLDPTILQALGKMLEEANEFVRQFQCAAKLDAPNLCLRIAVTSGSDRKRYNLPTVEQTAVFLPDQEMDTACTPRDIVVCIRGDDTKLLHITEFHGAFDPLHFVLLFPRGELGWTIRIPAAPRPPRTPTPNTVHGMDPVPLTEVPKTSHTKVTLREFMAFYLMERHAEPWCSFLHLCGGLFQEWIVLQWAKIEQQKLLWLKLNQSKIRADT